MLCSLEYTYICTWRSGGNIKHCVVQNTPICTQRSGGNIKRCVVQNTPIYTQRSGGNIKHCVVQNTPIYTQRYGGNIKHCVVQNTPIYVPGDLEEILNVVRYLQSTSLKPVQLQLSGHLWMSDYINLTHTDIPRGIQNKMNKTLKTTIIREM